MLKLLCLFVALLWTLLTVPLYAQTLPHTQEFTSSATPTGWFNAFIPWSLDSTSPSPAGGSAVKATFPPNMCGNPPAVCPYSTSYGPGKTYFIMNPKKSEYYVGLWFRWSNPFDFNPNSTKILYQYGTQTLLRTGVVGSMTVRTSIPLGTDRCCQVDIGGQGKDTHHTPQLIGETLDHSLNVNRTQVRFIKGTWMWMEVHVKKNTNPSVNDGVLEVWVDDVLVMQYTNVLYFDKVDDWEQVSLAPEWGGGGGTINQTQDIRYDHVVIQTTRIGRPGGTAQIDVTNPTQPTSFVATAVDGGSASFTWTASTDPGSPSSGVTGYQLLRCPGSCTPTVSVKTVGAVTTAQDDTLAPNTQYTYALKAVDGSGLVSISSTASTVTTFTSFRSTLATKTFTQADGTDIGSDFDAGYTAQTNGQVVSNRFRGVTVNTRSFETYNAISTPNDQWARAIVRNLTGAQAADQCVHVRAANAATMTSYAGCALLNGANTWEIREYTTGTPVVSNGSATYTVAVGDSILLDVQGTTLRLYRERAGIKQLVATATDSSIASGKAGVSSFVATGGSLANNELSDFSVGGFGTSTASAITVDAVSSSSTGNTTNTISWIHSVGSSCTNRELLIFASARDTSLSGDTLVTGITVGGNPATIVRQDLENTTGVGIRTAVARFEAPTTGNSTVVVTWTGALSAYGVGSSVSFCGVDQSSPLDAQAGGTGTGTAVSTSITTANDGAMIASVASGRGNTMTTGGSQTAQVTRSTTGTVDAIGISTLTKTTAGVQAMAYTHDAAQEWAHSVVSLKPAAVTPVVPPSITAATFSTSGASGVTWNLTTPPTSIVVQEFTNSGSFNLSTTHPLSDFSGGTYMQTWRAGLSGVCLFAVDAIGTVNSSQYVCGPIPGLGAEDTTPVVMTQTAPSGTLNKDTTSTVFSVGLTKPAGCRWATTNIAYDAMVSEMTISSLAASANSGSILSNGTTTHVYVQCSFTNSLDNLISTVTALDVSISVAAGAATDTTNPSTISALTAQPLGQAQVRLAFPAATDDVGVVGYRAYTDLTGLCTGYSLAQEALASPIDLLSLPPLTTISFVVAAIDAAGNQADDSNCATITTTAILDLIPPAQGVWANLPTAPLAGSIFLTWMPLVNDGGTATVERSPAGCTAFTAVTTTTSLSFLDTGLSASTTYCYRFFWTDNSSNANVGQLSEVIQGTTKAAGINIPRESPGVATPRDTRSGSSAGSRPQRP